MSKQVAMCSPITSQIYTGKINTKGMFVGKKEDITETATTAVIQHLMQLEESIIFNYKDKRYKLQVVEIKEQDNESI